MQGRNLENVATNIDAETVRQPVGVCAAIVPFNFPAMVPFWFLPFAGRDRQHVHPEAVRAGAR
jgi:malonate-semialdehyde dehydrogenase (acetylating)/methylmalonate-semialdehyde dehydrogenase